MEIFKDKRKGAKDDVSSLNVQFKIILINGGKYKIRKSKDCSLIG